MLWLWQLWNDIGIANVIMCYLISLDFYYAWRLLSGKEASFLGYSFDSIGKHQKWFELTEVQIDSIITWAQQRELLLMYNSQ